MSTNHANSPIARKPIGVLAALVTVTIWGGWVVATRKGVISTLTPYDVAFLRFVTAAAVLAPVFLHRAPRVPRADWGLVGVMIVGAGIPYFLIAAIGMQFAPAAEAGALMPGTMPLFTALLSAWWLRERYSRWRLLGLACIVAGVFAVSGEAVLHGDAGRVLGHGLFLLAAATWAGYTVAFRRLGLGTWQSAALINTISLAIYVPVFWLFLPSNLGQASFAEILTQAFYQGVMTAAVALITFGYAVQYLGASRAAAFSALTPVLAAVIGIPVLGETPDSTTLVGIAVICTGVAAASGVCERRH